MRAEATSMEKENRTRQWKVAPMEKEPDTWLFTTRETEPDNGILQQEKQNQVLGSCTYGKRARDLILTTRETEPYNGM